MIRKQQVSGSNPLGGSTHLRFNRLLNGLTFFDDLRLLIMDDRGFFS